MNHQNQFYTSPDSFWKQIRMNIPEFSNISEIPESFHFCDNKASADICANLVSDGVKKATASALWWYEHNNTPLPQPGELFIITDWDGSAKALIEITQVEQTQFKNITPEFAELEGEGDKTLDYWKKVHREFFKREMQSSDMEFDENMVVVCEYFKLIYRN